MTTWRRRWTRRFLKSLAGFVLLLGVLVAVLLVFLRSPWGRESSADLIQRVVQGILAEGYTFDRPTLSWTFGGRVTVGDVAFRDPEGDVVIGVRRLDLQLALGDLFFRRLQGRSARLDGVRVALESDADGVLNVVRMFGGPSTEPDDPDAPPWGGLPIDIDVDDLSLQDGVVSLWGAPPDDGSDPGGFAAKVVRLQGEVRLPRYTPPEVRVGDAHLRGELWHPGPTPVALDGGIVWTGDGVLLEGVELGAGGSALTLHGYLKDLWGEGDIALSLDAEPLDLALVDELFGAGLDGVYTGRLEASGSLAALGLEGALTGEAPTRGTLTVREGTTVCLPVGLEGEDACAGKAGVPLAADAPLRWNADLDIDGFHLEDVLPVIGGPLGLEGRLQARGGGTSWPDGVYVDKGRWRGEGVDVWGVPIRDHDLAVTLRRGVLGFAGSQLTGVAGTIDVVAGGLDLTSGALDLDLEGDLDGSMLADLGVPELEAEGQLSATLHGEVYADGVPIDITGSFDAGPVGWDGELRAKRLWGRFAATVLDGITDVGVDAQAESVVGYGADVPDVALSGLAVHVDPDGVTVDGRLNAPTGTYSSFATYQDVVATFDVDVPYEDVLTVGVDVGVGMHTLFGMMGSDGEAAFWMEDDQVDVGTDLRWHDDVFVYAPDVHLDLTTMEMTLGTLQFEPSWRQSWRNVRPLKARLTDDGVADADLSLASELGRLDVRGTLGTAGPLAATVSLAAFDLDVVAELFPDVAEGLDGVVTLDATLAGTGSDPFVTAKVEAEDLFVDGVLRWLGVRGTVGLANDQLRLKVAADVAGADLVRIDGYIPVVDDLAAFGPAPQGNLDVRMVLEPGNLDRVGHLLPSVEVPEGRGSGVVQLVGDVRDPDIVLQGVTELIVPRFVDPLRFEADVRREGKDLTLFVDAYRGMERMAVVDGDAATRLGEVTAWLLDGAEAPSFDDLSLVLSDLDLRAALDDLPSEVVLDAMDLDLNVQGGITGFVHVTGDPLEPDVEAELTSDLQIAGQHTEARLSTGPERGGYGLDLRLGEASDNWLTVAGHVPVHPRLNAEIDDWSTGTFDLTIDGNGLPLRLVAAVDPGLEVDEGRARLRGIVTGRLLEPQPAVQLDLEDGKLRYLPLGLGVARLGATLRVVPTGDVGGDVRMVHKVSAVTWPLEGSLERITQGTRSEIEGQGTVVLRGWGLDTITSRFDLRTAWLAGTNATQVRASGDVRVGGTWPDLSITGDLGVDQARIQLNTRDLATSSTSQVDTSIVIHRAEGAARTVVDDGPSVVDDFLVDVDVSLGRNTNLELAVPLLDDLGALASNATRADISARLGGDLEVRMRQGDLSIAGDVEVLQGLVDILSGKFAIDDGSHITFLGEDYANPVLEIGGTMGVTGGELKVRLTGTALEPSFAFESSDFGSDAAIFTILLTGQSPEELSSSQGQSALVAVSDLLVASVLGSLDFGSVSVEPDGSVIVGIPVFRTVFLESTYDPTPELRQNTVTVEAEWSILPRLIAEAAYGDQEIYGNLFYELRLTSLCDKARSAYERLGLGKDEAEKRCREIKVAVAEAEARKAEEEQRRTERRTPVSREPARREDPPAAEPEAQPVDAPPEASTDDGVQEDDGGTR